MTKQDWIENIPAIIFGVIVLVGLGVIVYGGITGKDVRQALGTVTVLMIAVLVVSPWRGLEQEDTTND